MTTRIAISLVGVLALAACGDNTRQDQTLAEATPTETAAPTAPPTPDAAAPQGFVDTVAASDAYEIAAAKLAQDMGKSDGVKSFAQMMVKDHTTSSANLRTAVAEVGGGLVVAPTMTDQQQRNLDQLRAAGENFDAIYAQQQVAAHEEALTLLQGQAADGTVAQLKTFAGNTAKVVEGHLTHARELP